jgi:hypothetical protein
MNTQFTYDLAYMNHPVMVVMMGCIYSTTKKHRILRSNSIIALGKDIQGWDNKIIFSMKNVARWTQ